MKDFYVQIKGMTPLAPQLSKMYNPSHSEVVSVTNPDREGCARWKHPRENNAEVV